jgi:hypothetical protein
LLESSAEASFSGIQYEGNESRASIPTAGEIIIDLTLTKSRRGHGLFENGAEASFSNTQHEFNSSSPSDSSVNYHKDALAGLSAPLKLPTMSKQKKQSAKERNKQSRPVLRRPSVHEDRTKSCSQKPNKAWVMPKKLNSVLFAT